MSKILAIALLVTIGVYCLSPMTRPVRLVSDTVVVKSGMTLYELCNTYYQSANNAESFDEFLDRNYTANGNKLLLPGQVVIITNKLHE